MEINLKRMTNYNNYNYGILETLKNENLVSKKAYETGMKALAQLNAIYSSVHVTELIDGSTDTTLTIIGVEE